MSERSFLDYGNYFVLIEESTWEGKYNPETKSLDRGEPTGWTKTHIIVQQVVGCGDWGMQILRFHGDKPDGEWELASNPYAGVYLKSSEWRMVWQRMNVA